MVARVELHNEEKLCLIRDVFCFGDHRFCLDYRAEHRRLFGGGAQRLLDAGAAIGVLTRATRRFGDRAALIIQFQWQTQT